MDKKEISDIFTEYEKRYEKILAHIYPAKNSTGFPERNLTVNFTKAYEKVAEERGQESISWYEMQFGERNNYHADAVIWNISTRELFIIESKRFSNPAQKVREISEDIGRIYEFVSELRTEDRLDMARVKKIYGVILADVWAETEAKKSILRSYEIGRRDPADENSFLKRNLPDLELRDLRYDVRDITAIETYFLLSFLWEVDR